MTIVESAKEFATRAHGSINQRRKYTGEPYINHPTAVVAILESVGITDDATLAAAWLHDVVEDTPVVPGEIGILFGDDVRDLVIDLTNARGGNRAERKAIDRERLSKADWRAQTIKVADLIDNTSSIVQHDPDFAKVYMREKRELLGVLMKADDVLWCRAWDFVTGYFGDREAA